MTLADKKKQPRTAPPETRRKQLIDATITCISKQGISGTTLTAVTKEAGLSLGLVNFHFKSKEALLSATLAHLAQEHRQMWARDAARADLTAAQKLQSLVDAQFHPKICSQEKLAVWFAFFGEAKQRTAYRSSSAQIDMERQEVCANLCQDIIEDCGSENANSEDIAQTLEGLFDGLWLNMLLYPQKFTRATSSRQVMEYLNRAFPQIFVLCGNSENSNRE